MASRTDRSLARLLSTFPSRATASPWCSPEACSPSRAQQMTSAAAMPAWTHRVMYASATSFVPSTAMRSAALRNSLALRSRPRRTAAGQVRVRATSGPTRPTAVQVAGWPVQPEPFVPDVREQGIVRPDASCDFGLRHLEKPGVVAGPFRGRGSQVVELGSPHRGVGVDVVTPDDTDVQVA